MYLVIQVLFLPAVLGPGVPRATEVPPLNQLTPDSTLGLPPVAIPIVMPVEFNRYPKAANLG